MSQQQVTTGQQIKTLLSKAHKMDLRSKSYLKEAIVPGIAMIFYVALTVAGEGSGVYEILQSWSYVFGPMSIMAFLRNFVYSFVNEKTEKYKETYKIMGMKQDAYFLSWLINVIIKGFVISSVVILGSIMASQYDLMGIGFGILTYILYFFASMAFIFFFSTFFSSAKLASEIYILVSILTVFFYYFAYIKYLNEHVVFLYLLCIFPASAINMTTYINNSTNIAINPDFTIYSIIGMLVADTVVFMALYFYLDEVFPNEYGTQKSWLFPCKCKNKNKNNFERKESDKLQLSEMGPGLLKNAEQEQQQQISISPDFSSAQYHEQFDNAQNLKQSVKIMDLRKNFGNLAAVDGVSLCLYERQIFCLLGHNGAGKTTTINLLTGLIQMSSGKAEMYDKDLVEELDEIRNDTGICNQKDVLYDFMTVEEHLDFLCDLKGVNPQIKTQKINDTIAKCNLEQERFKFSKNLSGGNKRKLSLAIALIGGSKIVFLDEPSSGLDPGSRRMIWDILKQVKAENRTIVLTTHHLEEAEELAERIGIMARGKLLTVGSSDFIKKKFGIGYHLKITQISQQSLQAKQEGQEHDLTSQKFDDTKRQTIKNQILSHIETAKYNPQSQDDTIVFTLPFDQRPNFGKMLKQLEQDPSLQIHLEINSLEDAFVNIGMEEDKYLNPDEAQSSTQKQEKYTDFNDIAIPGILSQPPNVTFKVQFWALFLRKYYTAIRTKAVFFAFIMPLIFIIAGLGIVYAVIQASFEGNLDESDKNALVLFESIMLSTFLILGYTASNASYCTVIVSEKETNLKYALQVMGCKSSSYWLGTYVFDFLTFILLQFIYIGACYGFQIDLVTKELGSNIILMLSFGLSYIAFSYLQSFMYTKAKTAQKFSQLFNFYVVYQVPFITIIFNNKWVNLIAMLVAPYYPLFWAFFILAMETVGINVQQSDFNKMILLDNSSYYAFIFIIQAIFYIAMVFYLDSSKYNLQDNQQLGQQEQQSGQNLEPDVVQEEQRILDPNCQDAVKISRLYKKYQNQYLAIKNNSFGVKNGEIFGLLGPNGAGKSTTFNVLTSLIPKTSGSVKMKNIEVNKGIIQIYENVGICAQFDALWEHLTVQEHLELFGRMKGLYGQDLNSSVNYFIQVMQLNHYVHVKSKNLSGGNKRKLCVSIALIGGPDIQFMDEPSSGVDAIARRFLWNTLTNSLKLRNGAITITTHSMLEADSLCHKIGILINGRFQCIGSPQYLKQKYGDGIIVTFKSTNPNMVFSAIQQQFPNVIIKPQEILASQEGQQINSYVNFPYAGFKFSETFDFFENQLFQNGYITDFSVAQGSLEQIFLQFSKMQHVMEENKNFQEPKGCFNC